ncbi:MAG: coproporphyrinogen-III oxidase family protein [Bacteroidota bacterium]|nr:coproporphyrinogen-III oxidase family protein [Bacteroidota bacterium]
MELFDIDLLACLYFYMKGMKLFMKMNINSEQLGKVEECIRYYPPNIETVESSDTLSFFQNPRNVAIYIHIPFCRTPCGFCPFNQYLYNKEKIDSYLNSLKKECSLIKKQLLSQEINVETVWIGGGTPMDLDESDLEYLLKTVNESFDLRNIKEFTIELKPLQSHITDAKLNILKKYNVNRISMGMQSTDNNLLKKLHRGHTAEEAYSIIALLLENKFEINVDMIYNLPEQTPEQILRDVDNISPLGIDHISWFPYVLHRGTPFAENVIKNGGKDFKDKERYFEMFCEIKDRMEKAGYSQYTPYYYTKSNQCNYHINRWKFPQIETIGIGAGAFSYFEGRIYANAHNTEHYQALLTHNKLPIVKGKKLNYFEEVSRLAVLGTKFFAIDLDDFKALTGFDLTALYRKEIEEMLELGLIELDNKKLTCTLLGKAFNNDLSNYFVLEHLRQVAQPQATTIMEEGL